jgi:hypothetical protein
MDAYDCCVLGCRQQKEGEKHMSLACHECGHDVQPSEVLPEREGGFIAPVIPAAIWTPDGENRRVVMVQPSGSAFACCFSCIATHIPTPRTAHMRAVYDAYNAETTYRRAELVQRNNLLNARALESIRQLREEWSALQKKIPSADCLLCGGGLERAHPTPRFRFVVFNRAECENNLSSFGSYQFSNITTGETHFSICFDCGRSVLPRTFAQFSHDLLETGHNNMPGAGTFEISIDPTLEKELGPDWRERFK